MTEAIRYVGQISKTKFRYEEHAIVADPNYVEPPNPALDAAAKADTAAGTIFGEKPSKGIFD